MEELTTLLTTQLTTFTTQFEQYKTSQIPEFIPTEMSSVVTLQQLNNELQRIETTFEKCNDLIEKNEYFKIVIQKLQSFMSDLMEQTKQLTDKIDKDKETIENSQRAMANVYDKLNEQRTNVKLVEEKS